MYDFLPAPKQDNVINIVNVVGLAHRSGAVGFVGNRHCHKVTLLLRLEGQIESSFTPLSLIRWRISDSPDSPDQKAEEFSPNSRHKGGFKRAFLFARRGNKERRNLTENGTFKDI